jgi:hypothetical protein
MQSYDARLSELESKVAESVRSYIRASRGANSSEENEAFRWTCVGLEWLLGWLLEGYEGWNGWVDGIFPATDMLPEDALKMVSPVELTVRGTALWGKRAGGPFWIEPFFASVQISEDTDTLAGYILKFADASRELGTVPYGKHLRWPHWFFPAEWLFTFSKGATGD